MQDSSATDLAVQDLAAALRRGVDDARARAVVFAGAGLSMAGPSFLPPAAPLVGAILDVLCRGAEVERALTAAGTDAAELRNVLVRKGPVPEALYQAIYEVAGFERVVDALRVLDARVPNANHRSIAAAAKAGMIGVVVTTNFDTLLERALIDAGQRFDTRVGVEIGADDVQAAQGGTVLLWKIHGTITDANDASRRQRIVTLLDQVARTPPRNVLESLDAALRDRSVLVVGYSGNDRDIAPSLRDTPVRGLWWTTRQRDPHAAAEQIMSRHASAARWLEGDLHELLGRVADRLGLRAAVALGDQYAFCPITKEDWDNQIVRGLERKLDAWDAGADAISPAAKLVVLASLLIDAGAPEPCRSVATEACRLPGPPIGQGLLLLGRASIQLGDVVAATRAFENAERAFATDGNRAGEAQALSELATLAVKRGMLVEARASANRAIDLAKAADDAMSEGTAWMAIAGIDRSDAPDNAAAAAERARECYRVGRSFAGELQAVSMLGVLASDRQDYARADGFLRAALDMAVASGDTQSEATARGRIGELLRLRGDSGGALTQFDRALTLYHDAGHREGIASVLSNRGIVRLLLQQFQLAESDFRDAIELWRDLGYIAEQGVTYLNLGRLLGVLGRWSDATEAANTALRLFTQCGQTRGIARAHLMRAQIGAANGDAELALEHAAKAAELFASVGAVLEEIDALTGLAEINSAIGRLEEAQRHRARIATLASTQVS
jgi:tetratricopeptide (TPR) repeat protein